MPVTIITLTKGFFPNWDLETDHLTYKAMLEEYRDNMPKAFFPYEKTYELLLLIENKIVM